METKNYSIKLFLLGLLFAAHVSNAQQNARSEEEEEIESVQCGGVERWSVKVLVDAAESTINFTPISTTVNNLVNIVTPAPSTTMPRYAGVEDKTYKFVCNVTLKKSETDNDYHLVLSDGTNTMIGEVPDPTCSAAASSAFTSQYLAARNFVDTYIGPGNVSSVNIAPVEIYGVAFVDPPHGQTGKAPNNLEIHPILSIQFASTTGVNVVEEKVLSVSVSPNPFRENLKVSVLSKAANLKRCSLQLFDMMANRVAEFDLTVKGKREISEVINTTSVAPGTYIYRIVNDGKPIYDGKLIALPFN
ncbi:MAG TPA: T9SS type A sorting domain-containing protein [Bacteroidia bacterium]|jgi:hypothetical protein|nr:T9SS type A sorting domain-containing protein [Bacteroidia bacterium]